MRFVILVLFLAPLMAADLGTDALEPNRPPIGRLPDRANGEVADLALPEPAAAAGYTTNTFLSHMRSGDFDLSQKNQSGFKWYFFNFFHGTPAAPSTIRFGQNYASIGGNDAASAVATAAAISGDGWVGTAFGGGFYVEALISFSTVEVPGKQTSWPSFWALSLEHCYSPGVADQWIGQNPGYAHFGEVDMMEYDLGSSSPANSYGATYGATVHDFYGVWNSTCASGYCNVNNAAGGKTPYANFKVATNADFAAYHRFGALWIPATSSSNGSLTFYFDGLPTNSKVSWTQYVNQAPAPGTASWTFGILDAQHLVLLLDTGARQPMNVQYVSVWQSSAAGNIVH
jgi:hypothetical protein